MTPERMRICESCGGQSVERSNGASSYRERLSAPIFEYTDPFIWTAKHPFPVTIKPDEGFVSVNGRKLTAHQARSWANALNSVADVVDQQNNNWTGPGPCDAANERAARAETQVGGE